jgi:type II secretory ATPase GspE/PulE/Tfp pilus assembly ATPase PilB-like protein
VSTTLKLISHTKDAILLQDKTQTDSLQSYADFVKAKLLQHQSDLAATDHAHPQMLAWCREQGHCVVLENLNILTSQPAARLVQNCKIVMQGLGLEPGQVLPAVDNLIDTLLENAEEALGEGVPGISTISSQQMRLRRLVKEAIELDATDIHIELREDHANIRFRKHGELFLHARWLPKLAQEIASVAFNKETDHASTHFNPLVPQNAAMPLMIDGRPIRLRLASLPAHGGYDVVMRLLPVADKGIQSLSELGYLPKQIKILKAIINQPAGAVIVSGPTGSGKTTTLASCMGHVNRNRKIITIEDPVEKIIPHATQVPVNSEHEDRGFANMTRTVLRMDPNVVVLGEMRDAETASLMVRASLTGHLVFSTVHTNTALDIVPRLVDLGVSQTLLAGKNVLLALICQRLAPLLCLKCAVPLNKSVMHLPHFLRWSKSQNGKLDNWKARGNDSQCDACHGLGIHGRTVVAEIVNIDERSRDYIAAGEWKAWREYLNSIGWLSFSDQLQSLVWQGRCDPLDAELISGYMPELMSLKSASLEEAESVMA